MSRHNFEVRDSQLLVDAPIIAVRRDHVTMPGGVVAAREIVEHLGAVAVVAVDSQQRVAMVNQYRHSVKRHLWELPAGLLDFKDETELLAAQRELQEEAGLQAKKWSILTDLVTSPGFCDEAVRVFLAQDLSEVEKLQASGDEEADMTFSWVPLKDAVAKILAGEIANSIAISGILAANEVLNHAGTPRDPALEFDLRPTELARRRPGPDLKKRGS